jgi:hypothetical protein
VSPSGPPAGARAEHGRPVYRVQKLSLWQQLLHTVIASAPEAVAAAGRKLTSDAIGDATGAVPKLQEGNSAISAFSTASARCS